MRFTDWNNQILVGDWISIYPILTEPMEGAGPILLFAVTLDGNQHVMVRAAQFIPFLEAHASRTFVCLDAYDLLKSALSIADPNQDTTFLWTSVKEERWLDLPLLGALIARAERREDTFEPKLAEYVPELAPYTPESIESLSGRILDDARAAPSNADLTDKLSEELSTLLQKLLPAASLLLRRSREVTWIGTQPRTESYAPLAYGSYLRGYIALNQLRLNLVWGSPELDAARDGWTEEQNSLIRTIEDSPLLISGLTRTRRVEFDDHDRPRINHMQLQQWLTGGLKQWTDSLGLPLATFVDRNGAAKVNTEAWQWLVPFDFPVRNWIRLETLSELLWITRPENSSTFQLNWHQLPRFGPSLKESTVHELFVKRLLRGCGSEPLIYCEIKDWTLRMFAGWSHAAGYGSWLFEAFISGRCPFQSLQRILEAEDHSVSEMLAKRIIEAGALGIGDEMLRAQLAYEGMDAGNPDKVTSLRDLANATVPELNWREGDFARRLAFCLQVEPQQVREALVGPYGAKSVAAALTGTEKDSEIMLSMRQLNPARYTHIVGHWSFNPHVVSLNSWTLAPVITPHGEVRGPTAATLPERDWMIYGDYVRRELVFSLAQAGLPTAMTRDGLMVIAAGRIAEAEDSLIHRAQDIIDDRCAQLDIPALVRLTKC